MKLRTLVFFGMVPIPSLGCGSTDSVGQSTGTVAEEADCVPHKNTKGRTPVGGPIYETQCIDLGTLEADLLGGGLSFPSLSGSAVPGKLVRAWDATPRSSIVVRDPGYQVLTTEWLVAEPDGIADWWVIVTHSDLKFFHVEGTQHVTWLTSPAIIAPEALVEASRFTTACFGLFPSLTFSKLMHDRTVFYPQELVLSVGEKSFEFENGGTQTLEMFLNGFVQSWIDEWKAGNCFVAPTPGANPK